MRFGSVLATLLLLAANSAEGLASPQRAEVVFRYPVPADAPVRITQPPGGKTSHYKGKTLYAYDFGIPEGSPIVAAADGEVVVAYDESTVGGCSPKMHPFSNRLILRHGDGTDTLYLHIAPGSIRVRSSRVKSGDVIAASGKTGYTCNARGDGPGAHLHFQRQTNSTADKWWQGSIEVSFAGPQVRPTVPPTPTLSPSLAPSPTPRITATPVPTPTPITWKDTGSGAIYQCSAGCRIPIATIPIGEGPLDESVKVNPVTGRVYVLGCGCNSPSTTVPNALTVVDGLTNVVVATVLLAPAPAKASMSLAVNTSTNRVYVASVVAKQIDRSDNPNKLYVIDGATNRVIATPDIANFPQGVAVNAATNRVYVGEANPASIIVLDGTTHAVVARSPRLPGSPTGIGLDPGRGVLYVDLDSKMIAALDATTLATLRTWPHSNPQGGAKSALSNLTVNPATNRVYVTNRTAGTVTAFEASTGATVKELSPQEQGPRGIAIDPVTNRVYVTFVDSVIVSAYDQDLRPMTNYIMDQWPIAADVNGKTGRVFVAAFSSSKLMVLEAVR